MDPYKLPPREQKKIPDGDERSDMDRLRNYSRTFEHEFNEGEAFPDKEDPADFWKKS